MSFLALTLIWLLNSARTPREWRDSWLSNGMLTVTGLLFVVLCAQQIRDQPWADFFSRAFARLPRHAEHTCIAA